MIPNDLEVSLDNTNQMNLFQNSSKKSCDFCGQTYVHAAKLERHIKVLHLGIKKELIWTCKFCSKVYSRSQELQIHISR